MKKKKKERKKEEDINRTFYIRAVYFSNDFLTWRSQEGGGGHQSLRQPKMSGDKILNMLYSAATLSRFLVRDWN